MDPDFPADRAINSRKTDTSFEPIEMPEETYDIKNNGIGGRKKSAGQVFDNSAYFEKTETQGKQAKYEAPGVSVRVEPGEVVEYSVKNQHANDRAVQEFVEGIVRSMDDVDSKFMNQVRDEVYERKMVTDGGNVPGDMRSVNHGEIYKGPQNSFETAADSEPCEITDGGEKVEEYEEETPWEHYGIVP